MGAKQFSTITNLLLLPLFPRLCTPRFRLFLSAPSVTSSRPPPQRTAGAGFPLSMVLYGPALQLTGTPGENRDPLS